jgi:hypothetical protein
MNDRIKKQYKVWVAFGPEFVIYAYDKKDAKELFCRETGLAFTSHVVVEEV